ncbi:hypothetical protein E4U57_007327 [Claviceps arundinis]|uniref:Uncharacterized protein n=1 Tax=Claviceps arundinis TaxID=1623583 RepID=A0A9P7MVU5_9HYPO|nr:hypothetical protein E4U57_007327 [Claviceps arundinis]KAG5971241.1 hypothetical protein E4U56_006976 [Claviceps arundinis]
MLSRAAAAFGRASMTPSSASYAAVRRISSTKRQLLSWPLRSSPPFAALRRNRLPRDLPIYFPRTAPASNSRGLQRRLGRIVLTTLIYYLCWTSFVWAVGPLWEALNEAAEQFLLENATEEERQEYLEAVAQQEAEPYLAFLPCPFATCEVEQPPYKISDPEWPAFLALHEDQQAQTVIKLACAEIVRQTIELVPNYAEALKGKKIETRNVELEINFPSAPPPERCIIGLMLTKEGIFLGSRPMDPYVADQIRTILYPKAVAVGAWTFIDSFCRRAAQSVARSFGFSSTAPTETTVLEAASGLDGPLYQEFQLALNDATTTCMRQWEVVKDPPIRGSINIDGVVELLAEDLVMYARVSAWYHVEQMEFGAMLVRIERAGRIPREPATS